jgi:hypothetical protein
VCVCISVSYDLCVSDSVLDGAARGLEAESGAVATAEARGERPVCVCVCVCVCMCVCLMFVCVFACACACAIVCVIVCT